MPSMLPPLILELAAKTGQFKAAMAEAGASVEGFAAKSDGAGKLAQKAALGMGLAYVGAGVVMVKAAGNFQQSQERLVTSAGESQKNLAGVSAGLETMAGQLGYSVEDLSKGMYMVESAGYHSRDGLTVMKAAAQGAKAENADLSTVSNALTDVLKDYHLKASDAAKVTSQMITATSLGKTSFEDFAGAFGNVMPIAAAAHLKFGEMAADLSQFTNHGISADRASQNMANAIRSLQSPSLAMTKAMAGYGISAQDVAHKLSQRGLAGTMQYLSDTILHRMGPSGMVLQQVMNTSKVAAQDANLMYQHLPKSLQKLADAYKNGSITQYQWTKDLKGQEPQNANLLKQWATMQNNSKGFAAALKSGSPAAKTYAAAMAGVTGNATSLNVALMLTGENSKDVNSAIRKVSGATADAKGNVQGWSEIQGTFNQKMSQTWGHLSALAVELGTKLLPSLSKAADKTNAFLGFLDRHQAGVAKFVTIVGVGLAWAFTMYVESVVAAKVKTAAALTADVAKGTWWVVRKVAHYTAVAVAATANAVKTAAVWAAQEAKMVASAIASGARWVATTVAHFVAASASAVANAAVVTAVWLKNAAVMTGEAIAKGAIWLATTIAQYVAVAASAVASAAATAAAWIAANLAMIIATGGILLAVGLLIAGGIWLAHHWRQVWADIKQWVGEAWQFMVGVFHQIENWFSSVITANLDAFRADWNAVWGGIKTAVSDAWNFIRPIIDGISSAVSGITKGLGGLKGLTSGVSSVAHSLHLPGFDEGGFVPGPKGKPMLAIVHGGEYVLTPDMQAGRSEPKGLGRPGDVPNRWQGPGGATTAAPAPTLAGAPAGHTINVYATTNANPHQIAAEIGWQLRMTA